MTATPENSVGGKKVSNKLVAAILAVLVAIAVGLVLFFQFSGNDEEPGPAPTTSTEVPTTPGETQPTDSPVTTPGETPTSTPTNASAASLEMVCAPEGVEDPFVGIAEKPVNTGDRLTDKPPLINGTPYAGTEEAMTEWAPVRTKFLKGLIAEGNILEAIKGTATPEVEAQVQEFEDGQFKDMKYYWEESDPEPLFVKFDSTEYVEVLKTEDSRFVGVGMEYIFDGSKGEWKVSYFDVADCS